MKQNVGSTDRAVRIAVATVVGVSGCIIGPRTALGKVLIVAGVVIGVTAVTRVCPLYVPLGVSTISPEESDS